MSGGQKSNQGGRTKSPASRKQKQTTAPPLGGRYSRSEGAGSGPERKHHNPPPKPRKSK
jgi:hypothetical protein